VGTPIRHGGPDQSDRGDLRNILPFGGWEVGCILPLTNRRVHPPYTGLDPPVVLIMKGGEGRRPLWDNITTMSGPRTKGFPQRLRHVDKITPQSQYRPTTKEKRWDFYKNKILPLNSILLFIGHTNYFQKTWRHELENLNNWHKKIHNP
jgi:hypothetical protein